MELFRLSESTYTDYEKKKDFLRYIWNIEGNNYTMIVPDTFLEENEGEIIKSEIRSDSGEKAIYKVFLDVLAFDENKFNGFILSEACETNYSKENEMFHITWKTSEHEYTAKIPRFVIEKNKDDVIIWEITDDNSTWVTSVDKYVGDVRVDFYEVYIDVLPIIDKEPVELPILKGGNKTGIKVGSKIEANYRNKGKWYSGKITREYNDRTFDISYDNGDKECHVHENNIILLDKIGGANDTRNKGVKSIKHKKNTKKKIFQHSRSTLRYTF
jgi:hypothetical protein